MPPPITRPGPEQDSILPLLRGVLPENLTDFISIEEPEVADDQLVFNLRVKLAIQSKPNTSSNTQNSMAFYKQEILAILTLAFVILILIFQLISLTTFACINKKTIFKRKIRNTEPAV
jgi:hypothetical protein